MFLYIYFFIVKCEHIFDSSAGICKKIVFVFAKILYFICKKAIVRFYSLNRLGLSN
jgi:hypothetical protein